MKSKKRLKKALFITLFFSVGAALAAYAWYRSQPKRVQLTHWCSLKTNASDAQFDEMVKSYHADQKNTSDAVQAFLAQKKEAGIKALQAEWRINDETLSSFNAQSDGLIAQMKDSAHSGCDCKVPAKFKRIAPIIQDILTQKGIHNASLRTVCGPRQSTPAIFFNHRFGDKLHFILELPPHFGYCDESFMRGTLEHELTHMACGHSIITQKIISYLADRDHISEDEIMDSQSMQKWMRACEYEADLLPAARNKETAYDVCEALKAVKLTDELHPPTRVRTKMLTRIARLHEADERIKLKQV